MRKISLKLTGSFTSRRSKAFLDLLTGSIPLIGILGFCGKLLNEGGDVLNKYLKITLGVLGVILLGIGLLVVAFVLEMKPDKDEEEK